jgi:hypothetical protein
MGITVRNATSVERAAACGQGKLADQEVGYTAAPKPASVRETVTAAAICAGR